MTGLAAFAGLVILALAVGGTYALAGVIVVARAVGWLTDRWPRYVYQEERILVCLFAYLAWWAAGGLVVWWLA